MEQNSLTYAINPYDYSILLSGETDCYSYGCTNFVACGNYSFYITREQIINYNKKNCQNMFV